jgi:hypothetical protein
MKNPPMRVRPLVALALMMSGCGPRPQSASDAPGPGWSPLAAARDTVFLDTAGVEWAASNARVWLRSQRPESIAHTGSGGRVAAVETRHDISCERREVRDVAVRAVGVGGEIIGDSVVQTPSWIPASAHPALQGLFATLCTRLTRLHPRGLHSLLGSDRP